MQAFFYWQVWQDLREWEALDSLPPAPTRGLFSDNTMMTGHEMLISDELRRDDANFPTDNLWSKNQNPFPLYNIPNLWVEYEKDVLF